MGVNAYGGEFFDVIDRASVSSARVIVPLLKEYLTISSAVDVGCGRGGWLKVLQECGARSVTGYDGAYVERSTLLIPTSDFYAFDLNHVAEISGTYDLAVCLEVAEHLPRRIAKPLIATLCGLAPVVLFSAAIPGQGGTNHVNEQWPHYWEALFQSHDYVRLDPFRLRIAADPRVALHFKQNLFMYVSRTRVEASEVLMTELARTRAQDVTVIATSRLGPLASVTGTSNEWLQALVRSVRNRIGV